MVPEIRISALLRAMLLIVLLPASSFAQFDAATVLGTVRDSSGAVVPGATVTLKNTATGIAATAVSDANGSYQFLNVRIGQYNVRAELQGFSTAEAESFSVTVNARQRVDLTLKIGNVGETVVVTGAAQLLETESSDRGTRDLPSRARPAGTKRCRRSPAHVDRPSDHGRSSRCRDRSRWLACLP